MKYILLLLSLVLVGCQTPRDYAISQYPTTGKAGNTPKLLIIHYTALNDTDSINVLSSGQVSIHYLIPSTPAVDMKGRLTAIQMVDEKSIAWHAGQSYWQQMQGLNKCSVGIEIVNRGFQTRLLGRHWFAYQPAQIELLAKLAKDIIQRYDIAPENVLGHSDISPGRKVDPGRLFPWQQLAEQGIGAWPEQQTVKYYLAGRPVNKLVDPHDKLLPALERYGYQLPVSSTSMNSLSIKLLIQAFQMHFRPADISGIADAETEAIALALVEKYRASKQQIITVNKPSI